MKPFFTILSFSFLLSFSSVSAQSEVTFYTTKGTFVAQMYDTLQPITAGNFMYLVKTKFYDGTIFHRVINGFMIQGGDPTGTGNGGPGYTIPDEINPATSNTQKTLAMANAGPNTGGSQFFINTVSNTYLNPLHPVFGKVITNFSVVQAIALVPRDTADRPLVDVVMDSLRITLNGPAASILTLNANNIAVDVYPNPVSKFVTVDFGTSFKSKNNYQLRITDLLGKTVYAANISKQQTSIDVSAFGSKGIYFLQITGSDKSIFNKKIIIQE
jgi:peptidylprolyl isomerase